MIHTRTPTTATTSHGTRLRRTRYHQTRAHTPMPTNQYQASSEEKNTAIRMIASKSSTVASVIRNARIDPGRALANNASTARENAMSVAVGMAQPWASSSNPNTAPEATVASPTAGGPNRA